MVRVISFRTFSTKGYWDTFMHRSRPVDPDPAFSLSEAFLLSAFVLALLNVGDGVSTAVALYTGAAVEANPIIASLMNTIGIPLSLLVVKGITIGMIMYVCYRIDDRHLLAGTAWFAALSVFYLAVVLNNLGFFIA